MSEKTNPQTLGPVTGAFLKYEATPLTRASVPATKGTKMGTFVEYARQETVGIDQRRGRQSAGAAAQLRN